MIYSNDIIEVDIKHIIEFGKDVYLEEDVTHPDGGVLVFSGTKLDKKNCSQLLQKGINRVRVTPNPNITDFLIKNYYERYDEDNLYELFPEELRSNMVLREDICDSSGKTILSMGTKLDLSRIMVIKDIVKDDLIRVYIPDKMGISDDTLLNQDIGDYIRDVEYKELSMDKEEIIDIAQNDKREYIQNLINLFLDRYDKYYPEIQTVVWALGTMKAEKAITAFFKTFDKIKDEVLLEKIIWAFGEIGNKRALVLIKRILRDKKVSADLKWACIFAIKSIGKDEEIEELIEKFKKKVMQKASKQFSVTIKSEPANLKIIRDNINKWCGKIINDEKILYNVILAIDEAVMNVIEHNYKYDKTNDITVEFTEEKDKIVFTVIGGYKSYNLDKLGNVNLEEHRAARKEGGLGVYFFKKFMDTVELKNNKDGLNKLVLTKFRNW